MAPVDDFESILKDVVQAKRLSASKMGKLTEIALKSMEHDTQLVSILYRTHKSLPTAAKVSSLYIFDALSRAARHQVVKQNITGDINSPNGNCATFLLKVEGILEGLFQDMITTGSSESKDKTKKILDIWVKGNTFPSKILSRLTDVVKETGKVPEVKPSTTSDPRMSAQPVTSNSNPPTSEGSPIPPAVDPQATLLALLAQAANAATAPVQTVTNTGLGTAGFDATQLAVLQQLALAQTASSAAPQIAPHTLPAQSGSVFPASYREEPYDTLHNNRRINRPQSPERVNSYDNQVDDHSNFRGFRGGFRGRGRGRWDDRDRDRCRDADRNERSPSNRGRRSRSRSPPSRYGGRRDVRPYSPPRRPNHAPMGPRGGRDSPGPVSSPRDAGKDEFGRDIRPQSPESDTAPPPSIDSVKPSSLLTSADQSVMDSSPALTSNHDRMSLSPLIAGNTSSSTPSTPFVSSTLTGLDKFNPTTFDFTSPTSWETLGKMWQVTHGYWPTTEQLMQFVMSAPQTSASPLVPQQSWQNSSGQRGRGAGKGRGNFNESRGAFNNGSTRNSQEGWTYNDNSHTTDAVVLGGTSGSDKSVDGMDEVQMSPNRNGGSGGRMQRVGDKWVFVRDPILS